MEFTLIHYKQSRFQYIEHLKVTNILYPKGNVIKFIRNAFVRSGSTAKLSQESNLIILLAEHNHGVEH